MEAKCCWMVAYISGMPPAPIAARNTRSIKFPVVWRSYPKGREAVTMRAFHLSLVGDGGHIRGMVIHPIMLTL